MPAIFVQGQGWVQSDTQISHQSIEVRKQTFTITLPQSFILDSSQDGQGFPMPYANRMLIEIDPYLLNLQSLDDVLWEWHFQYWRVGGGASISKQNANGKRSIDHENGTLFLEVDTPNFSYPKGCEVTLQATHSSLIEPIISNSVQYNRDGITVAASTEWDKLESDGSDNIGVSFVISNPFPKPKIILIEWQEGGKKIVLDSRGETQHDLGIPAPLPRGFTVRSDDRLEIFSKDDGLMGFQSSIGVNLTQPQHRPRILDVDTEIEDDRQMFEVTLDCPATFLDSTPTQPRAKVARLTWHGRSYRVIHSEEWHELEYQESSGEKLFFSTKNPLDKGRYSVRLNATMPDGEHTSLKKESFLINNGTVEMTSTKISTGQVHDHLEVHIEIKFESTIPNDFNLLFKPSKFLPYSERCSFFSGTRHTVKHGITKHEILLAIPLYLKENMELIEEGLSIVLETIEEGIDLQPIIVKLANQEEISCFRMHVPNWTDENHFKPKKEKMIEEIPNQNRKDLKYDFHFNFNLVRTFRPNLPSVQRCNSVRILYDRYEGVEAVKFMHPTPLDLQEHQHFFKKKENIAKMMTMSSEYDEQLSAEGWYFLRINAVSDDLYDPLEVFIHARFLIDNKHIFSGEFSALENQKFQPRISDYQKHRYELKNVEEVYGLETKYVIPDEAFDLNGAGEGINDDDGSRNFTLIDWVRERKKISNELEDCLNILENIVANDWQ